MANLKGLDPALNHHRDDAEQFLPEPIRPSFFIPRHLFCRQRQQAATYTDPERPSARRRQPDSTRIDPIDRPPSSVVHLHRQPAAIVVRSLRLAAATARPSSPLHVGSNDSNVGNVGVGVA
ncbi:hypothetical protein ACLOJK_007528 [Asimina triloba]